MCGRCLSEGRSLHDKVDDSQDDSYELKIYPGYCSQNPRHAAQQLIIRRKVKSPKEKEISDVPRPNVGVDLSIESSNEAGQQLASIVNPATSVNRQPSGSIIVAETAQKLINGSVDGMKNTQLDNTPKIDEILKPNYHYHFTKKQLHLLVLDQQLSYHPQRLKTWIESFLGYRVGIHVASFRDSEENTQNHHLHQWTPESIIQTTHCFVNAHCMATTMPIQSNATSVDITANDMSLYFTSVTSSLLSKYTMGFYQQLQNIPALPDNLSLNIRFMNIVPNPAVDISWFSFLQNAVLYQYQYLSSVLTFSIFKNHAKQLPSAATVLIFFQPNDDNSTVLTNNRYNDSALALYTDWLREKLFFFKTWNTLTSLYQKQYVDCP